MLITNMASWFVYLIECGDGTLYTGITTDISRRMNMHREGRGSKYVRSRGLKKIIGFFEVDSRSVASREEARIKTLPKKAKRIFFEKLMQ